jgi:uncharacterized protein (DUF433 family)
MNTTTMPTVTCGLFLMQQIVKFLITIQGKKHPGYLFSVAAGLSLSLKFVSLGKYQMMDTILNRITVNPEICNGKPIIRGKRITVQTILEFLGAGDTPEEVLQQYPSLEPEDIQACIKFAAQLMNHQYSIKAIA